MRSFYDDNFGHWEMDDIDDLQFYKQVQRRSVRKKCQGCRRMVKLLPDYAYCNACAERIERGGDF